MSGCSRRGVVCGLGAVISTSGRVFVHVYLVVTLSDVIGRHVKTIDSRSIVSMYLVLT
jgi:hypothetical protein